MTPVKVLAPLLGLVAVLVGFSVGMSVQGWLDAHPDTGVDRPTISVSGTPTPCDHLPSNPNTVVWLCVAH